MKHLSLLTLNRSWLAVLFFLFLPGGSQYPLGRVLPAENLSPIVQAAPANPGDLDPTFGNQGIVQADPGGAVAVQFDGKIIVAGSLNGDFELARYTLDGSIDGSFGSSGRVVTDFNGRGDSANAVAIQADGKILVAGSSDSAPAMARFNQDGSLDPIFGKNGKVLPNFEGNAWISGRVIEIALQPDGKIIAAGITPGYADDVAVARYNPDGSPDTSFGNLGAVILEHGDSSSISDVLVQPNGKIAVVGRLFGKMGAVRSASLARLSAYGSLDFLVGYGFPHGYSQYNDYDSANAVVMQSGGKFVIAGNTGGFDSHGTFHYILAMARFTADGVLDTSFEDEGLFLLNGPANSWGSDIQIQTDGKLMVSGNIENASGGTDFLLARFSPDGALDPAFGQGGFSRLDAGEKDYEGNQIVLLRDGRILLAGRTYITGYTEQHYVLARLLNDAPALVPRIWFPMLGHP